MQDISQCLASATVLYEIMFKNKTTEQHDHRYNQAKNYFHSEFGTDVVNDQSFNKYDMQLPFMTSE